MTPIITVISFKKKKKTCLFSHLQHSFYLINLFNKKKIFFRTESSFFHFFSSKIHHCLSFPLQMPTSTSLISVPKQKGFEMVILLNPIYLFTEHVPITALETWRSISGGTYGFASIFFKILFLYFSFKFTKWRGKFWNVGGNRMGSGQEAKTQK